MAIEIGQKAPDFKLFNTEKQEIALSDFRGKNVVIMFFSQAFTGTCINELCSVRDNYNDFMADNAVVLGISVDSIFTLAAFKKEQNLQYDLLSDFNKTVAPQYDSLWEDFVFGMKGVAKRAAFIIDKEGIIRYIEIGKEFGSLPNYDAFKAALEKI